MIGKPNCRRAAFQRCSLITPGEGGGFDLHAPPLAMTDVVAILNEIKMTGLTVEKVFMFELDVFR